MTRCNALVLDGSEVKLRLQAERIAHKTPVHVDWVRFTCLLRNVVPSFLPVDHVPALAWNDESYDPVKWETDRISRHVQAFAKDHQNPEFIAAMQQAFDLAKELCLALGNGFSVHSEIGKGFDFYKYRWSIHLNNSECGWVGFLASGDSPRQSAQALTIHANLYGHACTFAGHGWSNRIADIIDLHDAKLTRADLALDLFEGMPGGMESLESDYKNGVFDVKGKTPKCSLAGDWFNGAERSLYIGSKEAGKQTNVYEKGDQLFGRDSHSEWVRIELRYGNKLRVLSSDMLRRPADFFAGASDWHLLQVSKFESGINAQKCPQEKVLPVETVKAEVTRNVRWAFNTAAPTIAAAFHFLGDEFLQFVTHQKLPGRLQKFSEKELRAVYGSVMGSFQAVESSSPAFA